MLKILFKDRMKKVIIILCFALAAAVILKLCIGADADGYQKDAQELILGFKGLSYSEAIAELEHIHKEKQNELDRLIPAGSKEYYDRYNYIENLYLTVKNDLAVQRFSEEITALSNGGSRISVLPSVHVLSNLHAYSSLPPPGPTEQQSWRRYKKLAGLDPTSMLVFLILLFAYIPELEYGVYTANMITENGKRYYSTKFWFCALLSVFTAIFTSACDVLISGVLNSTDIFSTLRSVEVFSESFVQIDILGYLILSLIFRIMLSLDMLCLLYVLALKLGDMLRFIKVSAILFTLSAVLCAVLPAVGSFLPLCFAKLETQISGALYLGGITSFMPYFVLMTAITAAMIFTVKRISGRNNYEDV